MTIKVLGNLSEAEKKSIESFAQFIDLDFYYTHMNGKLEFVNVFGETVCFDLAKTKTGWELTYKEIVKRQIQR